nr:putative reverse transcriptase domain-containing protein [Tanacetum cinerariifolium]
DIPIYSKDGKEREEHLKAILELLKKEELYAKFSKCLDSQSTGPRSRDRQSGYSRGSRQDRIR